MIEGELTAQELESLIFYTNEEKRGAAEVLADKHEREEWLGGKKQKGICLIASGFGRGDNVDVEAVFLLDVNDTNDLLQKGGRTARNGEEGEVFQFYLSEELEHEEGSFREVLKATDPQWQVVFEELDLVVSENEFESCFQRVMLLREYLFHLQNEANQAYHNAIAKYSSWGMKHLGRLEDPTQREGLTISFSHQLKRLEKLWIDISSQEKIPNIDKVKRIEVSIREASVEFVRRYTQEMGPQDGMEFHLVEEFLPPIELVVPKVKATSPAHQAVAVICNVLSTLPGLTLRDERVQDIPELLETLADDEIKLQEFAHRAHAFQTYPQFVDALLIAAEQVKAESIAWEEAYEGSALKIEPEDLFKGVPDKTRDAFTKAISKFWPDIQNEATLYLCRKSLLSVDARMQAIMPVLDYLGMFSATELKYWGKEYIEELDGILGETSPEYLMIRLKNSPPMSLTHFDGLWRIAERYTSDIREREQLLKRLGQAIKAAPEHRIRMLTKWDSWSRHLEKTVSLNHLHHFCSVMERFEEGRDWDVFVSLVNKTQAWWNKDSVGSYQKDLLNLWQQLATEKIDLATMDDLLKWNMARVGKSWFKLLIPSLSLQGEKRQHLPQIEALWDLIEQGSLKKKEKTNSFANCMTGLDHFYQTMQSMPDMVQSVLSQTLLRLPVQRFKRMLEFVHTYHPALSAHPSLIKSILHCMTMEDMSHEQVELLVIVLINAGHFENRRLGYIEYLVRQFSEIGALLKGLPLDRFQLLMTLIQTHSSIWFRHQTILPAISRYMAEPKLSINRVMWLKEALFEAVKKEETCAGSINLLIKQFDDGLQVLIKLPDDKFEHLLTSSVVYLDLWVIYPQVLTRLIAFLSEPRLSCHRAQLLIAIVVEVLKKRPEGAIELLTNINNSWGAILTLPDDRLRQMMVLISNTVDQWGKYPTRILPVIMNYFCDMTLAIERTMSLSEIILNATKLQETYPKSLQPLLDILARNIPLLKGLPADKCQAVLRVLEDHLPMMLKYPHALQDIITYGASGVNSSQLINTVLTIVDYQEEHPDDFKIEHLLQQLHRFEHKSEAHIVQLNALMTGNGPLTILPLFDHTVFHMAKSPENLRLTQKEMVYLFHRAAERCKGDPTEIFNCREVKALFARVQDDPIEMRKRRVLFMNLLNEEALIIEDNANLAVKQLKYQWDNDANEQLLQLGFDTFIQKTKRILQAKPETYDISQSRDLSVRQQYALLQLTDELKHIGAPRPLLDPLPEPHMLKQGLNTLYKKYEACWFKSQSRQTEMSHLQENISLLLEQENVHGSQDRYQSIIKAISQAKIEALQRDALEDKDRWFKVNRGGNSRYFNTLNHMQDLVIRHWAADAKSFHTMQGYQDFNRQEFIQLTQFLTERVSDYCDETYLQEDDPRNKEWGRRISQLFMNQKDKDATQSLEQVLTRFSEKYNDVDDFDLEKEDVDILMQELREAIQRLPGYLATIGKEVLVRCDALILHLGEQESAGENLFGGAPLMG